jgi:hypothetical protein
MLSKRKCTVSTRLLYRTLYYGVSCTLKLYVSPVSVGEHDPNQRGAVPKLDNFYLLWALMSAHAIEISLGVTLPPRTWLP